MPHDKKAYLSDQHKETEKSNRTGKTRDLFKKSRDTKGKINLGTINDRNCVDLTEAEDIKKSGKNTQKKYTEKILVTQKTTMV